VLGGHGHRLAEAQPIELGQRALQAATIHLVGDEHHLPLAATQRAGDLAVERGRPGAGIDDEQHEIGFLDRDEHLPSDPFDQGLVRRGVEATGVDDGGLPPFEGDLPVQSVAGDAGHVAHQRAPLAHEPVEQRGLADVGPAHDRDDRSHHRPLRPGAAGLDAHRVSLHAGPGAARAARARRARRPRRALEPDPPA
jgi:hypothetical protein